MWLQSLLFIEIVFTLLSFFQDLIKILSARVKKNIRNYSENWPCEWKLQKKMATGSSGCDISLYRDKAIQNLLASTTVRQSGTANDFL